jgi:hypothetical protein
VPVVTRRVFLPPVLSVLLRTSFSPHCLLPCVLRCSSGRRVELRTCIIERKRACVKPASLGALWCGVCYCPGLVMVLRVKFVRQQYTVYARSPVGCVCGGVRAAGLVQWLWGCELWVV